MVGTVDRWQNRCRRVIRLRCGWLAFLPDGAVHSAVRLRWARKDRDAEQPAFRARVTRCGASKREAWTPVPRLPRSPHRNVADPAKVLVADRHTTVRSDVLLRRSVRVLEPPGLSTGQLGVRAIERRHAHLAATPAAISVKSGATSLATMRRSSRETSTQIVAASAIARV